MIVFCNDTRSEFETTTTTGGIWRMQRVSSTTSCSRRTGPVAAAVAAKHFPKRPPLFQLGSSPFHRPQFQRKIKLMQRSEKPNTCTSLGVGSNVVDAFPGPSLVLRLNPTLTLDPSPAMLSMVHDYDLATGENHEGRKP